MAKVEGEEETVESASAPLLPPLREEALRTLSDQQREVLLLARPPAAASEEEENPDRPPNRFLARVTAAAGTGKTTALLHLALRCFDLGHRRLTYITFTRASAQDAQERILKLARDDDVAAPAGMVDASTVHSCAMRLLSDNDGPRDADKSGGIMMREDQLRSLMGRAFEDEIEDYLGPARNHLENAFRNTPGGSGKAYRKMYDQAVFYLFKTFRHFCTSKMTIEEFKDRNHFGRDYYPVKVDFRCNGKACKLGFPPEHYSRPDAFRFFADVAVKIWEYVAERGIRSYDIEMKRAELKGLRIPGTVILVDECQDLDACQVSWIVKQLQFGTHVYFVGDAAQTIYSFRGAKSSNVASIRDAKDCFLTKSWRFGPSIAGIANVVLFAKERSCHTTGDKKLWMPYRVEGAAVVARGGDAVASEPLLPRWREVRPVALIGRSNGALMFRAMELLGLGHLATGDGDEDNGEDCRPAVDGVIPGVTPDDALLDFPKIHINGNGESSGMAKWRKVVKEIEHLYNLYVSGDEGMTLPENFRDFDGVITWTGLVEDCVNREIGTYSQSIHIINTYGLNTMRAINIFEDKVLNQKCPANEADIILTTCHSAKGLEWDHVELCDDFLDLCSTSYVCDAPKCVRHPEYLTASPEGVKSEDCPSPLAKAQGCMRGGWQFKLPKFGDELNLLYVACTRAKTTLCVPESVQKLLAEFDLLHYMIEHLKKTVREKGEQPPRDEKSMFILRKEQLEKGQLWDLYHDLVLPLRLELGLSEKNKLVGTVLPCDKDESSTYEFPGDEECPKGEVIPADALSRVYHEDQRPDVEVVTMKKETAANEEDVFEEACPISYPYGNPTLNLPNHDHLTPETLVRKLQPKDVTLLTEFQHISSS